MMFLVETDGVYLDGTLLKALPSDRSMNSIEMRSYIAFIDLLRRSPNRTVSFASLAEQVEYDDWYRELQVWRREQTTIELP